MKTGKRCKWLLVGLFLMVRSLCFAQASQPTLFFISNSHLDTQWNWDVRTTINEYVRNTMLQNFALLDKYPQFQFNYEGAIKYMWMKEYYPADFERLKTYVANGRWHVSGCAVDANDVMISSAESIMRNWLYATKFFQQEFGVRGGRDIMLPDCFGFSYALPSLAAHCGFRGFHTAKLGWGAAGYDQLPPFGIWQGVDGSQVYAIYKPHAYDTHEDYNKDMANDAEMLQTINSNYQKYGVAAEVRYVGPRGDRGGGLQDNASKEGENTPYWLNYSVGSEGPVKVRLASPDDIFDYLDTYRNSKYRIHNSELPMRTHGVGAYTSRTMLKLWNRRNELLADAAEKASTLAQWLGVKDYPTERLADAWVRNIWQAHHDGLTGTSIPNAYLFSMNDYVLANKTFADVVQAASAATIAEMDTRGEGTPIIVYNPLSWQRTDIVECSMTVGQKPAGLRVSNGTEEVLSQVTGYDESTGELRFIFAATVPAVGYAVYHADFTEPSALTSSLTANAQQRQLSNGRYRVSLNVSGDMTMLYDLANSRNLMSTSQLQMIYDHEDTWPSWEISYTDVTRSATTVNDNVKITLAEDGPLRKSFRVERSELGSTFVHYVRMNALNDRIECVTEADWQTHERMLKVQFPFTFSNPNATYDISLGTIQRGNRTTDCYEVQGHQWADLSTQDGTYGVSVLNDCKYGWDKPNNNTLRLTLIHTPSTSDSYTYQAEQDLGVNHFTYALFPHQGSVGIATQQQASQLNQPLLAFTAPKHEGTLGCQTGFLQVSTDAVSVKALKKSEFSNETIVRVYEWAGQRQENVGLTFPAEILSVREVNGLEQSLEMSAMDYSYTGKTLTFNIGKYQPKTFAVTLKPSDTHTQPAAAQQPVDLSAYYNIDVMSSDSKKNDAATSVGYAYPAEQVADRIQYQGQTFLMGPREDGKNNAVRFQAQTIDLGSAATIEGQKYLYMLLGSTNRQGGLAEVIVGDETYVLEVPYVGGTVGQLASPFNAGTRYRKQDVALTTTHSHNISKNANEAYGFLYMYHYILPLPDGVTSFTLPRDNTLLLYAATVSNDQSVETKPLTELPTYIDYSELVGSEDLCGEKLTPRTVSANSYINSNEAPSMASDMNELTKWCVDGGTQSRPYIEYRFTAPVEVCQWMVLHAGSESGNYITKSFKLQRYEGNKWVDVDVVTDNKENKTVRGVEPFTAERIRLQIEQGEQNGKTTRIYEFAVYGRDASGSAVDHVSHVGELAITGMDSQGNLICQVPAGVDQVTLHVTSLDGRQLFREEFSVSEGQNQLPMKASEGVRLCLLTARRNGQPIKSEAIKLLIHNIY